MAKISNLICAEKIKPLSGSLIIENPVTIINMDILPNNYSFFVSFSIVNIQGEINPENYINILLETENGESVLDIRNEVPDPSDSKKDEMVDSLTCSLSLNNVKFNEEGLYTLKVSSDLCDTVSTYFSLRVK